MTELLKTIDPASLKKQIDAAVATLDKGSHGAVLFKINREGASIAAVGQALNGHVKIMAKITRPWSGGWDGEVGAGISFAVAPSDVPAELNYASLVMFFEDRANSPIQARMKAAGYLAGFKPYVSPDEGFCWDPVG